MNTRKILLLVMCLCAAAVAHAQFRISLNSTEGETYLYRMVTEQQITQNMMGMTMPSGTRMDFLISYAITESAIDEVRMDFSLEEIKMEITSPMMSITIDSNSDVVQLFQSIIGVPLSVTFGRDGTIKSMEGFDIDPASLDMASAAMLETFNTESMRKMLEQSFGFYPAHEVNIGDSWETTMTTTLQGMDTVSEATYTLVSVENNVATIGMVINTTMSSDTAELTSSLTGESIGEMRLDIRTGMIIDSTASGTSTGTLSVQGMDVQMSVDTTITITREQ